MRHRRGIGGRARPGRRRRSRRTPTEAAPSTPPSRRSATRIAEAAARARPAPYKVTIPNTTVSYDMAPDPGRRVHHGVDREAGRAAAAQGPARRLLDAGARSHVGRVPPVHVRQPGRRDHAQGRSGRRGQPSHQAVRRDELRDGHQRLPRDQHDAARRQQIRRVAERQDRRVLPPADRGRVGVRLPRRRHAAIPAKLDDVAWYADEQPAASISRSRRRSRMRGASTTCSATSWSGRSTSTRRTSPASR